VGANRPNFANPLYARFSYVRPHAVGATDWWSERPGAGASLFFRLQRVRRPSACFCALQSSGRSTRRMRLKTVRSGGSWPSAIASVICGDRNPNRSNLRTDRLSRCSRHTISSTELTCAEISSSAHRRARATALSTGSSTRLGVVSPASDIRVSTPRRFTCSGISLARAMWRALPPRSSGLRAAT
jgi:hypothetical protein